MCVAFSCNEADVLPDTQSEDAVTVQKVLQKDEERDALYTSVARNLAAGLEDQSVRSFIQERVNDQFDGDYNFLVETSKDEELSVSSNGRSIPSTFGNILFDGESSPSERTTDDFLRSIGELYPLMQVALPQLEIGSAESWDVAHDVPLVAFIPSDYDESNENATITAYDFEGNQYELSAEKEPDRLVIVISDNERLIALEKPESTPSGRFGSDYPMYKGCPIELPAYHENERYNYYFRDDVYQTLTECKGGAVIPTNSGTGNGGSGSGSTGSGSGSTGSGSSGSGSSSSSTPQCDRDVKDKTEQLYKAKFRDMGVIRDVESWASGKPEVIYYTTRVAYAASGSHYTFTSGPRTAGKEGWYKKKFLKTSVTWKVLHHNLFKWLSAQNGDEMVYTWIEEDTSPFGGRTPVNVTFTGVRVANASFTGTATISIGAQDDYIGNNWVQYCDNTDGDGTLYTNSMQIYVRQRK